MHYQVRTHELWFLCNCHMFKLRGLREQCVNINWIAVRLLVLRCATGANKSVHLLSLYWTQQSEKLSPFTGLRFRTYYSRLLLIPTSKNSNYTVVRPLSTKDNTNRRNTNWHPCFGCDSNQRSKCLRGRRHFMPWPCGHCDRPIFIFLNENLTFLKLVHFKGRNLHTLKYSTKPCTSVGAICIVSSLIFFRSD
jgi:hypothetical protein